MKKAYKIPGGGTAIFDAENPLLQSITDVFFDGDISNNVGESELPKYKLPMSGKLVIIPDGLQGRIFDLQDVFEIDGCDGRTNVVGELAKFFFAVQRLRHKQDASFELEKVKNSGGGYDT